MASKVYTRKGDKGKTSIMGTNERFLKSNARISAIGSVDELNAYVGMIKTSVDETENNDKDYLWKSKRRNTIIKSLITIQNNLFTIGSLLAGYSEDFEIDVDVLEKEMDEMSKLLKPLKNFILAGGDRVMSYCHLARTVCRRSERAIVKLTKTKPVNDRVMIYINRLSDYFFVLARFWGYLEDIEETIWKSK